MLSFIKRLPEVAYWSARLRLDGFPVRYLPHHHELETLKYFRALGRRLRDEHPHPLSTQRNIALCFTNRCGSNWLAEILYSTGLVGSAQEYFNAETIRETCDAHGLKTLDEYIHFLPRVSDMQNGTFATKLSWDQLYFLTRAGVIPQVLPNVKFIYMRRHDLAQQALSLLVAEQTGQWNSHWNSGIHAAPNPEAIADEDIILAIESISQSHEHFRAYFDQLGIEPCIVSYRDLLADPEAEAQRVLQELGIDPPKIWHYNPDLITLKKQRNERTELRLKKFHHNTGNIYAKDFFTSAA